MTPRSRWFTSGTYAEDALDSGAPVLAQNTVVGVKSVEQLLGRQHREGVLQKKTHKKTSTLFFLIAPLSSLPSPREEVISHQHVEGREQVVHREVREAQVGRFLGAQRRGERQQLGNPDNRIHHVKSLRNRQKKDICFLILIYLSTATFGPAVYNSSNWS